MKVSAEFHSILVKTKVMRQIGVNKSNLLEVDEFKYIDASVLATLRFRNRCMKYRLMTRKKSYKCYKSTHQFRHTNCV